MQTLRQAQKKRSREKNNVTTIQLSKDLKSRLLNIQEKHQFLKQDEALDEVISFYEDNYNDHLTLTEEIESE